MSVRLVLRLGGSDVALGSVATGGEELNRFFPEIWVSDSGRI